jgi:hypothetical protein
LCGLFSLIALILWAITKQPYIAIVFAILSDGFAAIPTLVKSWTHPESESGIVYLMGGASAATALFAVKSWIFPAYGFVLYLIIVNAALVVFIFRKKFFSSIK